MVEMETVKGEGVVFNRYKSKEFTKTGTIQRKKTWNCIFKTTHYFLINSI